ncbi:Protein of unknown function [Gryllus bimaculatus]|nr:Protein of unknown function [Gryllus bimaculatus]
MLTDVVVLVTFTNLNLKNSINRPSPIHRNKRFGQRSKAAERRACVAELPSPSVPARDRPAPCEDNEEVTLPVTVAWEEAEPGMEWGEAVVMVIVEEGVGMMAW